MVRNHHHVGVGSPSAVGQPAQDIAELSVGLAHGGVGKFRPNTGVVLGLVRLRRPDESNRWVPFRQYVLGQDAHGVAHAGRVGTAFFRPGAEAGGYVLVQGSGKGKLRVDGSAAADFGIGVMQVGVAAGTNADGHVFLAVPGKNLGQSRG